MKKLMQDLMYIDQVLADGSQRQVLAAETMKVVKDTSASCGGNR
jgi:hypothetical protein